MTPNGNRWEVPPLSTASVEATTYYRDGIAALVAGIVHAGGLLSAAMAIDPGFVLARVGLAVVRVLDGDAYAPPSLAAGRLGRGERQHVEVVRTALTGDPQHAAYLRREHLLEFPGDLLIVWLPVLGRAGPGRDDRAQM